MNRIRPSSQQCSNPQPTTASYVPACSQSNAAVLEQMRTENQGSQSLLDGSTFLSNADVDANETMDAWAEGQLRRSRR